jgi:platelet-activating factor acetylhydrolase
MLSFLNPLPALPAYTGAEKVGTAEYEIPISSLGFNSIPDELPASTIKFRVFYPARPSADVAFGVPWLPEPQTTHLAAYLRMARLGPWLSKIFLSIPLYLRSTTMPAYKNAALHHEGSPLPVLIFSHGLVGSMNSHSALLGELASRGVVCVAIDHRDGSGALSLARSEGSKAATDKPTEITSIYYKNVSLKIRPGVWEARDRQFEIRLFELVATYKALGLLNEGEGLTNLAGGPGSVNVIPRSSLNLKPGEIIWAGHSFGGATLVQFIKTIYHESRIPPAKQESDTTLPENSLLLQPAPRSLVEQIKATSPLILLDPWFMPLRSPRTRELNSKPLPCHYATSDRAYGQSSTTIAVLSSECAWHWPEVHSHMPQILAADPQTIKTETEAETIKLFENFISPRHFMNESKRQYGNSRATEKDAGNREPEAASAFVLHDTTHVTLSDFGLMFPWITWWFTGQKQPELANWNVARCILKAAGLEERIRLDGNDGHQVAADGQLEQIYY